MAFSGEVHNRAGTESLESGFHFDAVANISLHKLIARMIRNAFQIVQIARVRQLVEVEKMGASLLHLLQDEVRADEARTPGNQNSSIHLRSRIAREKSGPQSEP